MPARLKVYFDGGCRPNPGPMEIAVVAVGRANIVRDLGEGSSADAEWLALIHALRVARSLSVGDYLLMGDALSVIRVANGEGRCPKAVVGHLQTLRDLAGDGGLPPIRYVKRTQNLAGIALAGLHPR